MNALQTIQAELKAPKSKTNTFGNYKYRNCEDILEAVKPLLQKYNAGLVISDDVQQVGPVVVVTAKVTFTDEAGKETIVTAHAGVDINKKGMDVAQTFGASSSYARKYALNGLFLIDDTKDYDSDEYRNQVDGMQAKQMELQQKQQAKILQNECQQALKDIQNAPDLGSLNKPWSYFKNTVHAQTIESAIKAKRDQMGWTKQ